MSFSLSLRERAGVRGKDFTNRHPAKCSIQNLFPTISRININVSKLAISHQSIRIFEFKILQPAKVLVDCNLSFVVFVMHVQ